jgi:REP element-mobilizing transposase RayT
MDDVRYPKRKHPRMKHYDYATPGYYFVTICTHDKMCLFGKPQQLNSIGQKAKDALEEIPVHFLGVSIDKYVVMPNHIHAIIILTGHTVDLSTIVGSYKAFVSKEVHKSFPDITVWQASFHDHVIRDQKGYEHIWTYIDTNPQQWENDCFYV